MANTQKLFKPILGVIGGTAWPSTITYLEKIRAGVQQRLGGQHSPNLNLVSRDFEQLDAWMHTDNWPAVTGCLTQMAMDLRQQRADAIVILSNTLHKVADDIVRVVGPRPKLINIGEFTASYVKRLGLERVGFLGTEFTMKEDFIIRYFREQGIEVVTPAPEAMLGIDNLIFNELCNDKFNPNSRRFLFSQVAEMIDFYQIQAVILGCTELGLTMTREHWQEFCRVHQHEDWLDFPLIDSLDCHVEAIVDFCCGE